MDRDSLEGFTLPELMVVLVITAIMAFYAVSGFNGLIRANRLAAQMNWFITALNLARNEAITRNGRVVLCVRSGNDCGAGNNWSAGWIVFADDNGDFKADAQEIIRLFEPLAPDYLLKPNVNTASLIYYGDGRARRGSGGLPMMTFRLCAPDTGPGTIVERSRELVISASGRMRLQKGREGKTACP